MEVYMTKITQLAGNIFDDKKFYRKMAMIATPIIIQNLISSLLNMMDTVMVGKLGEIEIAAVGIANQYFFFFNMILIGLCGGCSVFISQYWGKRDEKSIKKILGIGLLSASIVALIFMVAGFLLPKQIIRLFNNDSMITVLSEKYLKIVLISYIFTGISFVYNFSLRSINNAILPMIISIIALFTNVFFNYIFIFGKLGAPALGVEGAALATVIARIIETILLLISVYLSKGVLAASLKELMDFTFDFVKKSYQTIFPVILNDMCWGLASLVYAAVYGHMGAQAIAIIQICNTVNNLFMVIIFGLSSSASIMIGNSIGAGNEEQGRNYAKKMIAISFLLSLVLGAMLAITSPFILDIFNVSSEVRSSAQTILYMVSFIFFIRVTSIVLVVGVLRGGGDAGRAFIIEGFTMWFIGVPLTILGAFVFHFPVHIVYALALVEELVKCILAFMRIKSGKWIKNVTY